jgi:Icc protein
MSDSNILKRIAHLSDVHMLGAASKARAQSLRVKFVSIGRTLDVEGRAQKLASALRVAKTSGAEHFVISGDLTEVGAPEEFDTFAGVLQDAKISPDAVTLVPGNHDAYTAGGWRRAMDGPLAAFRGASATDPGKVVDRGNVAFLPLDLTYFQSVASSRGEFSAENARALEDRLADPGLKNKALVMLVKNPSVQLLHGHMHRMVDRIVGIGKKRAFGASAVVDDPPVSPRVRLYDVRDGMLESVGLAAV